ncbi:hypothetical protein M0805_000335 [Coniferiporia weirii]|nr:hypothetical protein M0805_000335 [Coniferiporia weirii]
MISTSLLLALFICLAALFPCRVPLVAASQELNWISPLPDALYYAGDIIVVKWTSMERLVSPSVSVCAVQGRSGGSSAVETEDRCGGPKWPSVKQSELVYSFSLVAPNATSGTVRVYLRVKDTSKNVFKSPSFLLSPDSSSQTSYKPGGTNGFPSPDDADEHKPPDVRVGSSPVSSDNGFPAQAPLNDFLGDLSSGSSSSTESRNTKSITPRASAAASIATTPASRTAGAPMSAISGSSEPNSSTTAITVRAPFPTAVFAVPFSLVTATLLASIALCLAHRRSLAAQRARNAHIKLPRSVSASSTGNEVSSVASAACKSSFVAEPDVEKAVGVPYESDRNPPLPHTCVQGRDSVVHAPNISRYPVPRRDVRREQAGWAYVGQYLEYSSRPLLPSYRRSRLLAKEYARSLDTCHRSVYHCGESDRNASETDIILSGNLSPQPSAPRLSYSGSYCESLRVPPRLHISHTAPELDDCNDIWGDVYDAVRHAVSHTPRVGSHAGSL